MDETETSRRSSPYLLETPPRSTGRVLLATGFSYYCALHWGYSEREITEAFAGDGSRVDRDAVVGAANLLGPLFARGAIRGWARPFGGGEPVVLKDLVWELDDFSLRFASSALDPRRPFDADAPPTHWIFADAADWEAMIAASVADVARRPTPATRRTRTDEATSVRPELARGGGGFLRLREVERLTGLSRSTIYRKMEAGRFPRSVPLSENIAGWREEAIAAWIDAPV